MTSKTRTLAITGIAAATLGAVVLATIPATAFDHAGGVRRSGLGHGGFGRAHNCRGHGRHGLGFGAPPAGFVASSYYAPYNDGMGAYNFGIYGSGHGY